ncbi:MAG: hypothetical protein JNL67_06495 [Planctomycetaceae bacterium]|nr:hypothetical protein [Planctomycetaceae bacterium]
MKKRKSPSPKIPARWLFALLALAVLYILLQPIANQQFGWNLPTLGNLLSKQPAGDPPPKDHVEIGSNQTAERNPQKERPVERTPSLPDMKPTSKSPELPQQHEESSRELPTTELPTTELPTPKATDDSNNHSTVEKNELLHGVLRSLGREEYVSPAGLRYTRGSAEGHRLNHIERHLNDQPERSGRHGVFRGDMEQFLQHIDQSYLRAKRREPRTSMRNEDGRTIYEATFDKPIGYIGGREGARLKRPATNKLRVVVDEDRVITAFPY